MKRFFFLVIKLCSIIAVISNEGNELPEPPMCGVNPFSNRIIGGDILSLDEHPWMALLDFELTIFTLKHGQSPMFISKHINYIESGARHSIIFKGLDGVISSDYQCGGALINTRYVVTAAHCLSPAAGKIKRKLTAVRLGEHDLLQFPVDCEVDKETGAKECAAEPIDYEIEKIILHPLFNSATKFNDIALVRLAKPVEFTVSIKPVCLPTGSVAELKTNDTLYSIGWGSTNPANIADSTSSVKRIVGLRLWDILECFSKFRVLAKQLCAGGAANQDACIGDSGGPFLKPVSQYWYLEGVISYGYGCGKLGWPGIYTNVRSYLDWIKENLEP